MRRLRAAPSASDMSAAPRSSSSRTYTTVLTMTIAPAAATARSRASRARNRGPERKRRIPAVALVRTVLSRGSEVTCFGRITETTRTAEARKPATVFVP